MPYGIYKDGDLWSVWVEDEEGNKLEKVPDSSYTNEDDAVAHMLSMRGPDEPEKIMKEFNELPPEEILVSMGGTVKLLDESGKIGGYLVRFGNEDLPDLEGDFFTKETNFGVHYTTPIYYHHGYDSVMQRKVLGVGTLKTDDVGVWVEAQLELRDEYEKMLLELIRAGKMGLSSGTAGHLVERQRTRKAWKITEWPLGLDASVTPTPAEPRTNVMNLKAFHDAQILKLTVNTVKESTMPKKDENLEIEEIPAVEDVAEDVEEVKTVEVVTPELDYEKLATMVAERIDPVMPTKSVNVINADNLGDPDPYKALTNWMRGESNVKGLGALGAVKVSENELGFGLDGKAVKAALQEGTTTEGGYIVPNDFYAQIIQKRDQVSIPRQAGARVINTSRDVIDIPIEDTKMTNFVLTAEEAAYDENEPTFNQVSVTIYKYTKLVKISEELVEDEAANLDGYLSDAFGRAWGLTENAITLVGTGSSQPQGVFVGGSVGVTFADTNSIAVTEIPSLFWSLGDPYHDGSVWVTRGATLGSLQGLTGSNFQLVQTPPSDANQMQLWYKSVFLSDSTAAMGTGAKSIIFGNWSYYALVNRHGLIIQRNPYLYQGNGQIGIFAKVRLGGAVLQSEAFKWGIHA